MKIFVQLQWLFLFSIVSKVCVSQEHSNWYFGNGASLHFSDDIQSGEKGALYTDEGCASVTDENGNLIFYTNGVKIWDNTHKVINKNNHLAGHKSSTQSAVIVSNPANLNEYFIFTCSEKADGVGVSYSTVSVKKQGVTKNEKVKINSLKTPDLFNQKYQVALLKKNKSISKTSTEKLVAIPHANGESIWIVFHQWDSNTFISILLNKQGKLEKKIYSKAGSIHTNQSKENNSEAIGQMKVSPNYKLLALAVSYRNNAPVELFDFNNQTGKINLKESLPSLGNAYGIEFSSDNSKLYVSYLSGPSTINQYDLESNYVKTSVFINDNEEITYGGLQLGPDGKIYVSKISTYLDVISNPNASGKSCGYKLSKVSLNNKFAVYGLPSKPIVLNALQVEKIEPSMASQAKNKNKESISTGYKKESCISELKDQDITCQNSTILEAGGENVSYKWSTGDTSPSIKVSKSDYYSVSITGKNCSTNKTVYIDFVTKHTKFSIIDKFNPKSPFNNYLALSINDVSSFSLKVKKKGGKIIFLSTNTKDKWYGKDKKGKIYPEGTYSYEVNYIELCGGKNITKKGQVEISYSAD